MIHTAFVVEQHVGHRTYYENLRRFVDERPDLAATWVPVTYSHPESIWERCPGLPANLRSWLIGRSQVKLGLRHARYDVALFNTQAPAALAGRLVQRQPYVLSTDITPLQYDRLARHYGHQADGNNLIGRYKHQVNCRLMQSAAALLPWSTWARDSLTVDYHVNQNRNEVIPPGVDTDIWHPTPKGQSGAPVRILFVGGDFHRKGGDILLQAFRNIRSEKVQLILVTRSGINSEPHVHLYTGMKPNSAELIALYQTCDIFVLPSRAEAFGIAAVEASAAGLPVIATAVGGLTDIVKNGETGFLIAPADVLELARCLQQLINDAPLRHRLGSAARKRALTHFDARKNAARIVDVLRNVAATEEPLP